MQFNQTKFSNDIKAKRGNTPLREIAAEINISAATISRIENYNIPDLITYAIICKWLNVSMNAYFGLAPTAIVADILNELVEARVAGRDSLWAYKMKKKIDQL